MNDDTGQRSHLCRRGRPRQRLERLAAAIALAGVPLLAAACGNSSGSAPSTPYAKALAYSQCMRANGVPRFPDPGSQGQIPVDYATETVGQFQHASKVCQKLAPSVYISPQREREDLAQALKYVTCMRAHGLPDFPDPSTSGGGVGFDLSQSILSSPQFSSAKQACQSQAPGRAG